MSDLTWQFIIKFIIVGDAGVGKSSILIRFTDSRFLANPDPTLGVEFGSKLVHLADEDKTIKVQIWDTAGAEQFRSITRSYYRGAAGALLVYDATSRSSFNSAKSWLQDVREHADPNLTCILVANKVDLIQEGEEGDRRRAVTQEEAAAWAEQEGLLFLEGSAKTGQNIEEAFETAVRDILDKIKRGVFDDHKPSGIKPARSAPGSTGLSLEAEPKTQGYCCT
ncbi:ras-domain-containing protein [Calocera viscosa TUFC12733]|uniref:Ras-domain-containing protein n=1 Tax=Calocera viscosa (strain TUFC12733) TaxID=1330018 RepID=A0A167PZ97_CALVF|nr:ras-domain-containing protein [Calocera viscosa TUFC12733]